MKWISRNKSKIVHSILIFLILYISYTIFFIEKMVYETKLIVISNDIVDEPLVKKIAEEIKMKCDSSIAGTETTELNLLKKQCQADEVLFFILKNITYKSDNFFEDVLLLNNKPSYTTEHGGDCENQAVLALDILKTLNFKNIYLVYQKINMTTSHACWMILTPNQDFKTYNCMPDAIITNVLRVN